MSEGFKPAVRLPAFEGPLDLLLHLVRENRLSIWDIPIATICDQYHAWLSAMEALDLELAGEYLVYAAWLLAIKSRLLLPRREREEDPRKELVERLLEYEKVKRGAAELAGLLELHQGAFPVRVDFPQGEEAPGFELEEVDLAQLGQALRQVLERFRAEHPQALALPPLRYTVREKVEELYRLLQQHLTVPLLTQVLTRPDRLEGVTYLLAGLELVRLGSASVHQSRPFAEIYLTATSRKLAPEDLAGVGAF